MQEKRKNCNFTEQSYSHVEGRPITVLVSLVSMILMEGFKVMTDKEQLDLLSENVLLVVKDK